MALLDSVLAQAGNLDLGSLGARVGLDSDQVRTGAEAILGRIAGGGEAPAQAAEGAAIDTGLPLGSLQAMLPALTQALGQVDLSSILSNPSGLIGALDRDGDGGVMDDLGGLAKGLFGGRG